ncbi:Kelch-type beta propeller [Sesbania bispinosa]|nr:Kelch-type beta propeller [Sesbania bispinosa]
MRWEKVEVGEGPGKRWGHTCNAVKGGRFLYLFGGYGKYNRQTNQVHVFDTVKQTWSQPAIKGCPPTPRDSHSCTTVGDYLFVFGGTDGTNLLKDLHILDTSSHTWISPSVKGEGPEAREGHSAALVGKSLFVFGGCGKSAHNNNEVNCNDLYILNTGILWEGRHGPEKLSLKKQLKLKCQEQNLNPVQPITVSGYRKPSRLDSSQTFCGKNTFLAKVTESSSDGYAIETVIEGKRLHGFVFLNKPNTLNPATNTSSRKRTADETGSVISNGMHLINLTTSKVHKQNGTEDRQGVLGDGSESHEHLEEAVAAVIPSNPITASSSNIFKVSANHEPEPVPLNRNDDEENDRWKSLGEKLKNDGANDTRSSEGEARTDEQTDVTISNSEAAENTVCLSKQGMKPPWIS